MVLPSDNREIGGRLRVLHVLTMLHNGGVERWVVDLCRASGSANIEMEIAVLDRTSGIFAARARESAIPIHYLGDDRRPLAFIGNVRRLLREQGPYNAIHCHLHAFSCFALLAARLEGVPVRIVHSHNVVGNSRSSSWTRRGYSLGARTLLRLLATAGLAPSAVAIEDLFGSAWRRDPRWGVLPYGIDLTPFRLAARVESSRTALGIPAGALVLGSVGRLTEEKNSEFLLDVLSGVLRVRGDSYLLLVGEGPFRETLERKANQGGYRSRLVLPGARSDVPALLRDVVDVFVFPSPPPPRGNEAAPIAVLEAQAAGLHSVLSDGVPPEAMVVSDLIVQIPVAAGAAEWADAVFRQAQRHDPEAAANALAVLESSNYNISVCMKTLSALYRAAPVM